jgi:glycosyltransferase involved in cell wall biosynthesis
MSREVSPKDAVTAWKLYRLLRRERPDIVHTHTAKAGTVGRLAGLLYRWLTPSALRGRPRRVRFVHTYHGHVFHSYYGPLKTKIFLTIERALAWACTDRIVVISPQQYREIHRKFGVGRAGQFVVIPLGLDTDALAGALGGRAAARREFGADEETLLVGIVGRLTEIKNHRLFLSAAARFKQMRAGESEDVAGKKRHAARVRFVVIGDGHLRPALEEQARALGLTEEDVLFAGTRHDPEHFYPALDIVALTSLNEGTPLTLIEAMATGRAVAATAVGGVVDLLGGERPGEGAEEESGRGYSVRERGLAVRSGDAEGFARALARLVADEELRRDLGARGPAYVAENYSVARLVSDVTALYESLCAGDEADGEHAGEGKWAAGETEKRSAF